MGGNSDGAFGPGVGAVRNVVHEGASVGIEIWVGVGSGDAVGDLVQDVMERRKRKEVKNSILYERMVYCCIAA